MPNKGQKTITVSASKIPKKLQNVIDDYNQSLAGLTIYCLWLYFGDDEQQKKAKKVLGLFA